MFLNEGDKNVTKHKHIHIYILNALIIQELLISKSIKVFTPLQ